MTRRPIQLAKGAIIPSQRETWAYAAEKLQEAENCLVTMRDARERAAFEGGWCNLVDALQEFWIRFCEEGKTISSAFQPWAGGLDRVRRSDPMLQYLYQSRHQSQHAGLALEWSEPQLVLGRGFAGRLYGLRVFQDGTYDADALSQRQGTEAFPVEYEGGNPKLPTIENKKHAQRYSPPTMHLGEPLADASPVAVAELGLRYYRTVLDQARLKFCAPGNA